MLRHIYDKKATIAEQNINKPMEKLYTCKSVTKLTTDALINIEWAVPTILTRLQLI
jgi:hypothetical protein